ncbi:MAG: TSUP family transporter, partial [Candidatus Puniceispirillales bacterium]
MIPAVLSGFFDHPATILAIIATFLVAGTVKGVIGIGMPAICMVLLTLFLPPLEAIPLTAIPTMVVNLLQIQRADARHMVVRKYGVFGITLLVSIFLTGYFILSFPETLLLLVLGMAMVIFAVQSFAGLTLRFSAASYWQVICGIVTGFIGGLSSVFSPPIVMYLLGREADKDEFIAATGFLFFAGCAP